MTQRSEKPLPSSRISHGQGAKPKCASKRASTTAHCGAKTRPGHPCKKAPGWGTDHVGYGRCKLHGGASPSGKTFAIREQATVEAARLGVAIETDPHEALSTVVNIIAGQVSFLQSKVAEIEEGEELSADALHPTIRAMNGVLEQWQRAAKAAVDAGVAKRAIELDEAVVARLADAVRFAMAEVDLTQEQEAQLRGSLSRHLATLDDIEDWRRPRGLAA